ncbi:MAG: UDP-N-acetylglucosamine--N-acetylmuramyl-(pentapeptide) pyrophosphoryl-undecaprenol N-acetylglucosamine transferase [Candidatus Dojkabacteria bacterium]
MDNRKELKKRIIVTGGGSGGHISTASAIINAINKKYLLNNRNFLYVGGDLGMEDEKPGMSLEKKIFASEEFNQEYIRAGKLQRKISLKAIYLLLRVFLAFFDSFKIIRKFKPDIVISTGGFVTLPVCIVAKLYRADVYLHEQVAAIILSNRIVSKIAKKIFVTFTVSSKYFPKDRTIHTGNLVRPEIFNKSGKGRIVQPLKTMIEKQEEFPIVYISGGSLGSHIINTTIQDALPFILESFQIVLQTGDNKKYQDYDLLKKEKKKLPAELKDRLIITKYVDKDEIGFLFNNIDMFVGRAGANTVYEMGVLKIPSIFIPIPWVPHNEQYENAKILQDLGLADIIREGELTPECLILRMKNFYKKEKAFDEKKVARAFPTDAIHTIMDSIGI